VRLEVEVDLDRLDDIIRRQLTDQRDIHMNFEGEPDYQEILDALNVVIRYYGGSPDE